MKERLYKVLTSAAIACENCRKSKNTNWFSRWLDHIETLENNYLPSGSGFDGQTVVDKTRTSDKKLVICSEYHVMNPNGYYDGWITFDVVVTPSLQHGFNVNLSGISDLPYGLEDYISDTFDQALNQTVETV